MILAAGPATGGVADVFRRVVGELRDRGHDVVVAMPAPAPTPIGAAIRTLWRTRAQIKAADVVHLEFGSNDLDVFWLVVLVLLIRRDCVVVAHDFPKIVHLPAEGLLPARRPWGGIARRVLSPFLDARATRFVARRAGTVLVFGEEARAGWRTLGARYLGVLAHGSDPHDGNVVPPSQGESVLFAGYIGPSKGIDVLLSAWEMVETQVSLPLVFAGQPDEAWFRDILSQHGSLTRPPTVLGPIPDEQRFQELIARAAIVVLPYRYSSPASGILVRAMAAGRAIVVTPIAPACDAIDDGVNGLIIPMEDPRALARAIARLGRSPDERDRLGAAAAHTAARMFSWKRHVDGLEMAYAAVAR